MDIGRKEISYGLDERDTARVLEDFSVRTLFDKLEDQTLHLTSQLGRHRNETLSFYKAFIQRIQLLKDMMHNLELGSSKGFDWRKVPLDGEVESLRTNITLQQSEGSAASMTHEFHADRIQGEFLQEAAALMKALKLTLMKTNADHTLKKEDAAGKQHLKSVIEGSDECGAEHQNQSKNPYEAVMNGNLAMLSAEGLHFQPLQFMTALYREENLRRLISTNPLSKTLEEIKEALKAQAEEKKTKETLETTGDLVPMNISQLSPRQLVVYRFGSAILHFACQSFSRNPLLLLVAQSIPRVRGSLSGREALRLGESYVDTENNVLFVPGTSLEHAGELAVCIVHAVTQINTGQQQTPVTSDYLHCMNKAVVEICRAFFRCWGTERTTSADGHEASPMARDLLFIHKLPECYHMPKSNELHKKMDLGKDIERTFRKSTNTGGKKHRDELDTADLREEALDDLNEAFLQLVTQALQNKNERKALAHELECSKDPSVLDRLSEKTHEGVMLEIKRRYTEEKIRTAESDLPYLQRPNTGSSPVDGPCEDCNPPLADV